jgi:hypothetical protein
MCGKAAKQTAHLAIKCITLLPTVIPKPTILKTEGTAKQHNVFSTSAQTDMVLSIAGIPPLLVDSRDNSTAVAKNHNPTNGLTTSALPMQPPGLPRTSLFTPVQYR